MAEQTMRNFLVSMFTTQGGPHGDKKLDHLVGKVAVEFNASNPTEFHQFMMQGASKVVEIMKQHAQPLFMVKAPQLIHIGEIQNQQVKTSAYRIEVFFSQKDPEVMKAMYDDPELKVQGMIMDLLKNGGNEVLYDPDEVEMSIPVVTYEKDGVNFAVMGPFKGLHNQLSLCHRCKKKDNCPLSSFKTEGPVMKIVMECATDWFDPVDGIDIRKGELMGKGMYPENLKILNKVENFMELMRDGIIDIYVDGDPRDDKNLVPWGFKEEIDMINTQINRTREDIKFIEWLLNNLAVMGMGTSNVDAHKVAYDEIKAYGESIIDQVYSPSPPPEPSSPSPCDPPAPRSTANEEVPLEDAGETGAHNFAEGYKKGLKGEAMVNDDLHGFPPGGDPEASHDKGEEGTVEEEIKKVADEIKETADNPPGVEEKEELNVSRGNQA